MRTQTCNKHNIPLDGCVVEYFGVECPLCKLIKENKALLDRCEIAESDTHEN